MKEPSPAFQFYPRDWLADLKVRAMPLDARGAYIDLIAMAWLEGSIPSDSETLRRLCGFDEQRWVSVEPLLRLCWSTDPEDPSKLVHPRVERERQKQRNYRETKARAGRASAASRAGATRSNTTATARQQKGNRRATESNVSSSSVRTYTHTPRTSTHPKAAPAGAGGGGPDPDRTGPDPAGAMLDALDRLGIRALDDHGRMRRLAVKLEAAGIAAGDLARLDLVARRRGQDHDGGDGRGLLLTWLEAPDRAKAELAAYDQRNPASVNGADLSPEDRAASAAAAEQAAEERRARLRTLTEAIQALDLEDGVRPALHAERLDDVGLGVADLQRLDAEARKANANGDVDPGDDPDGRALLAHWLSDSRRARGVIAQ